MKRVLPAIALALMSFGFAGAASAQSSAPSFTFIGSGCPADEDAVNYHWEGSTLVVNFAGMSASKGPGVSLLESRRNCSLTMDLKVPNGLKYTLVGYRAAGYDSLGEGDSRSITVSSFFQGSSDTATFTSDAKGLLEDDFRVKGFAAPADLVWSPCNAQRAQTINTAVRVSGSDRQAPAFSTVESLRLYFRLGLCVSLPSEQGDDQVSIESAS